MTNFDIDRLLADASDDTGEPLRRPLDNVVRRGRRRVLRRQIGGAATGMLAIGCLVSGVVLWLGTGASTGGGFEAPQVAGNTSTGNTSTGKTSAAPARQVQPPPPVATMPDREIVRRCKAMDGPSESKAGGGTDPIDNWKVLIKQAPHRWVQAVLVSPDGQRRAYCVIDTRGNFRTDYNREAFERADYKILTGGIDGAVDRVPDRVARVTFETPDGVVSDARIKDHIVLWFNGRHADLRRPIWATFYDAAGKQLARFNAIGNPVTCGPDTGGPTIRCG